MWLVKPNRLQTLKKNIDLEKGLWIYTPPKTKKSTCVDMVSPLSTQAMQVLSEMKEYAQGDYVFPSKTSKTGVLSENTMNQALKRLGYTGEQQTIHGFRASARTMIVEQLKYDEQLVEMQLGHAVRDMHGKAYNRTTFLDERRKMLQAWADYLDELKKQE